MNLFIHKNTYLPYKAKIEAILTQNAHLCASDLKKRKKSDEEFHLRLLKNSFVVHAARLDPDNDYDVLMAKYIYIVLLN